MGFNSGFKGLIETFSYYHGYLEIISVFQRWGSAWNWHERNSY